MPVPDGLAPWDELAAAELECLEANRSGAPERQRAAFEAWLLARERCGLVGGLLLVLALEHAGQAVLKKLDAAFGGLAHAAWDKATTAEQRADWAVAELDALRQRVRELERAVSNLTPGMGEPRKAA